MAMKLTSMKYMPLMAFQIILMILFFIFVRIDSDVENNDVKGFEDTHVMIFIGFGFLMTFLKKYSYSALGFNWLLAALVIQWALLCQSFYSMKDNHIYVTKKSILEADIMSATVLITFGALLGVASGMQLIFIAIVETAVACLNMYLVTGVFKAADVGGSIAIHTFGAYFGLGVSLALRNRNNDLSPSDGQSTPPEDLNGPTYISDVTAMIGPLSTATSLPPVLFNMDNWQQVDSDTDVSGHTARYKGREYVCLTQYNNVYLPLAFYKIPYKPKKGSIFLWIYWPSFNSGLASPEAYQRAVINTYLSLAASTVTAFAISAAVSKHKGVFDMVHIQNSTLAGGVAVGAVCNMHIGAGGAIAVGIGAGLLSVVGYRFLTPKLANIGVLDTCGVNNLHGMPGIYSGLLSILFAALATKEDYKNELYSVFPGIVAEDENQRSARTQALYQLIALAVTLGLSTMAGLITGLLAKLPMFKPLKPAERYDDELNWELP